MKKINVIFAGLLMMCFMTACGGASETEETTDTMKVEEPTIEPEIIPTDSVATDSTMKKAE
jgi:hypothetical protein